MRGRLQRAAAEALQDAVERQLPHRWSRCRTERRDGEDRNAGGVEALAAELRREPAVERHRDDAGEQVAGDDPRGIVERRPERAGDRVQADVDDRAVDDRHDHAEHDRQRDQERRGCGPRGREGYRRAQRRPVLHLAQCGEQFAARTSDRVHAFSADEAGGHEFARFERLQGRIERLRPSVPDVPVG